MTETKTRTALILFAHGARDPGWAAPLSRVREAVRGVEPEQRIEIAFLELMPPTLRECATDLIDEGFERIVVVPMFIAQGGHLKRDVPKLLDELRALHPHTQFDLAGPIGETESVILAMATHIATLTKN